MVDARRTFAWRNYYCRSVYSIILYFVKFPATMLLHLYTVPMHPEDPVDKHFTRLRPEQKRALAKLGIRTIRDLLYHFPARYESSGSVGTIAGVSAGAEVTLYGTVRKPDEVISHASNIASSKYEKRKSPRNTCSSLSPSG